MNLEKLIRFGFASPRRRLMTIVLAGAAGISSFLGFGGDKAAPAKQTAATTSTTVVQAGAVVPVADVSYANCDEVRKAGKAPIHRGDPGYSSKLDRDGDGTACS